MKQPKIKIEVSSSVAKWVHAVDYAFLRNVVLAEGISLAPVIVLATSMSVMIDYILACFMIIVPTVLIGSVISDNLSYTARTVIYTLIASLIFIPAYMYLSAAVPESVTAMGIFLPIIVVNPLMLIGYKKRQSYLRRVGYCVTGLVGFAIAALGVCIVRNLFFEFTNGNIIDFKYIVPTEISSYPFVGFIILGLFIAFFRWLYKFIRKFIVVQGGDK